MRYLYLEICNPRIALDFSNISDDEVLRLPPVRDSFSTRGFFLFLETLLLRSIKFFMLIFLLAFHLCDDFLFLRLVMEPRH